MTRTPAMLAACLLALCLSACGSKEPKNETETSSKGEPSGSVAAKIDGEEIPRKDVQRIYRNLSRQNLQPDPEVEGTTAEERLYRTALKILVDQTLIEKGATASGVTVSDAEVTGEVARLTTQAGGEEAFQKLLLENDATLDDVSKDVRSTRMARTYFERVVGSPQVEDAEIEAYFQAHPEQFGGQPEVNARHILMKTEPTMDDITRADARRRADAALLRVKSGEDFAKVANEITEDPTNAGKGGDLGWFGRGNMVAPFDSAAFALAPGSVSGIVETNFGYHVIRVEGKRETPPRSIDEVREGIRRFLTQEKAQGRFRAVLDSIRAESKVELLPVAPEDYQLQ